MHGLAPRIALVALASSVVAIGLLTLGVWVVGGQTFAELMMEAGDSAEHAHEMFDASLRDVLLLAIAVAGVASVGLAIVLSRRIARPLADVGAAAQRVAGGDYAARVPERGPSELASLAGSFNRMAADLEESERQRRDLIANTAHELRTPLTNLGGYVEALRDGVITADRQAYDSLLEEVERLVRLARSLDDLALGDRAGLPARPVDLDLAPQLAAAAELVRPVLDARRLVLERRWPERLPAHADPDHVAQVLANLLQNAARYTPDGGRLALLAEARADVVLVSLANSGDGIPPEDLPHVFERFYRVEKSRDRSRGGAGIGLAIVRQLVEGWGGRVGVESRPGLTRFWFSLPRARTRA
jgi:two-component system, OmpR family, sensor histidine kinase BaeS